MDPLGIASHLWFPAPGGLLLHPRPAPGFGSGSGEAGRDPQKLEVCGEEIGGSQPWLDTGPSAVSSGSADSGGLRAPLGPFGSLVGAGPEA